MYMMPVQVPTTASAGNQNSAHMHASVCLRLIWLVRLYGIPPRAGMKTRRPSFAARFCAWRQRPRACAPARRVSPTHTNTDTHAPAAVHVHGKNTLDCDTGTTQHHSIHGAGQQRGRTAEGADSSNSTSTYVIIMKTVPDCTVPVRLPGGDRGL